MHPFHLSQLLQLSHSSPYRRAMKTSNLSNLLILPNLVQFLQRNQVTSIRSSTQCNPPFSTQFTLYRMELDSLPRTPTLPTNHSHNYDQYENNKNNNRHTLRHINITMVKTTESTKFELSNATAHRILKIKQ
jgi:hypothetical protein